MRRTLLLALLASLALPAAASAAPAVISPRAPTVSAAGVARVEVANPNAYVLRGTASVTAGGSRIASRTVRLPRRAVSTVTFRFDAAALRALRAAGGRASVAMRLRRAGGRSSTARRTLTLRLPAPGGAPAQPAPAPAPAPPAGTPTTPPAPPTPARWIGRMGAEGPYDDLELTVADGQLTITKPPLVPVVCFENGGAYRSALSLDPFVVPGPWALGAENSVVQQGISGNQLVSGGGRSITYKVTGAVQEPGRVSGTLGMSFFDSKYDVFTASITFVNCSGSQGFEAVPAG